MAFFLLNDEILLTFEIVYNKCYKDILLQYTRKHSLDIPRYIIKESGKSNERIFQCTVSVMNAPKGKGKSSKKKDAEQKAAFNALVELGLVDKAESGQES